MSSTKMHSNVVGLESLELPARPSSEGDKPKKREPGKKTPTIPKETPSPIRRERPTPAPAPEQDPCPGDLPNTGPCRIRT